MSSDLSDIADDFRLGRVVHESGRLTNAEISEYEEILVKEQSNLLARARLLGHFNRLDCSNKSTNVEVSKSRFNHISWFVHHIPDSRFCGESHCYLDSGDPNYSAVKEIWLEECQRSNSLMRHVNAFMFSANGKDSNLNGILGELSGRYHSNFWISALQSYMEPSKSWSSEMVENQLKVPSASPEEIESVTNLFNNLELNKLAGIASSSTTKSEFYSSINRLEDNPVDPEPTAIALGYTFSSYLSSSVIGFNPELTAIRFGLMCWLIRNAPGSQLASHAFAMDPLDELDYLNDALSILWERQIASDQSDKRVLKNVAIFAAKLGVSPVAQKIVNQLSRTKYGKQLLAEIVSQY